MLNMAQMRGAGLLPRDVGTPFAEFGIPAIGRATGEGDSLILLRLLLRAQASALEYELIAAEAAKDGPRLVAALCADAAAIYRQLAERAAEVGQKLGNAGKKERRRKAK